MSREKRIELIKGIEQKRNSKIISYITSDRKNCTNQISMDAISIIHDHLLKLENENNKLDLFIYSRGGYIDVPWALVSMFREYSHKGSFNVLIPYRAHSAATLISLGADEVVMTKKGELGPVDATIANGPYNPLDKNIYNQLPVSIEDINGFFALLDRVGCERSNEKIEGFKQLTEKVHPLVLGAVNKLLEEIKLIGLRLLNSRTRSFSDEDNTEIIKKLSSEIYTHNHIINRTEANRYLGLRHVKNAETLDIDKELWDLYLEYKELFDFENPFQPEEYLVANNLEENSWENIPTACIESINRFDLYKQSIKVKRLRNIPPKVTINLSKIKLPQINITSLPKEINMQEINQIFQNAAQEVIQTVLNKTSKKVAEEFTRSLPQKGFEHIVYKSGWKQEA